MQFGDLIQYVDFNYVARVAKVNAAALWALAILAQHAQGRADPHDTAGRLPRHQPHHAHLERQPESNLTGYEVVMRETTFPDWTSAIPVGNVTSVTLNISKDNVQFGLRAVDSNSNRSPVAFPATVA